ncbi:MAG: PH domain-containing protein, partial [Desulfobacteraceae bacterium]
TDPGLHRWFIPAIRPGSAIDSTHITFSEVFSIFFMQHWGGLYFGNMCEIRKCCRSKFKIVFAVACVSGAALVPWILYGTSYTLTDEALLIRCGPFHQRVMVRTIQEVAPSRNAVSSSISPSRPALAVSELSNM